MNYSFVLIPIAKLTLEVNYRAFMKTNNEILTEQAEQI